MKKTKILLAVLSVASVAACAGALAACNTGHEHEYTETKVAATCTEQGYTLHTCACGDSYKDNYVNALGHDTETHSAQTKTCTQDGWDEYETCKRDGCDYSTKVLIPAGHTVVEDKAVPYDCTHDGKTAGSHCSVCGTVLVEQQVLPASHYEVTDAAVPATCTTEGKTAGSHCKICEDVLVAQKTVPMLVHDIDEDNVCKTCHQDVTTQGLVFTDIDATTCKLTGLGTASTATAIYIPKEHNGKTVTTIGTNAIKSTYLTAAFIPNSVTTLENQAVATCSVLTYLSLPDSLETLDTAQSIYNCNKLEYTVKDNVKYLGNKENPYVVLVGIKSTDITACNIPEGCKIINWDAFVSPTNYTPCRDLAVVTFPESLVTIYDGAFAECSKIANVKFGNNLKYIGAAAFDSCYLITELVIPDSVETIGKSAFYGCKIVDLTVPFLGESRTSAKNHISYIYGGANWDNNNSYADQYIKTLKVTDATTIAANALRQLRNLETLVLSDKVTNIASNALNGCTSLTVYYEGTAEQWADVSVDASNNSFINNKLLYLSADAPAENVQNFWHYVGTVPTKWDEAV